MFRELNRKFQDYMRPRRLALGKYIFDRRIERKNISKKNILKDEGINSILIFRPDGKIGDMVVSTILFREIKKKFPYIKIGVVSRGAAIDIIKNNKNVDKIYNYSKRIFKIRKLAKKINKENYDLLLDFSEILKTKEMMFINLSKVNFNIGINKKDWNLFDLSFNGINYNEHISNLYEKILKKLGVSSINLNYEIILNKDNEKLKETVKKDYIVFNPYAASKYRSFNFEKIIEISKVLLEERNEKLVLIGKEDKYNELKKIKKILGKKVVTPEIKGILQTAEIIKNSKLVVTPDTSIVHVAVAYDRKIIGIYRKKEKEDNNFIFWGPNSKKARVIFVKEKIQKGQEIDINKLKIEELKKILKEQNEELNN